VLKRMALRLAGAALLVLSGCLAIAWLAGWSGGNETHFFVPAAALQGNAQPYLANMAGDPSLGLPPYTSSQSGFLAPQQTPRDRSFELGALCGLGGLVGVAAGLRVAAAAVTPPLVPAPRRGFARRGEPTMQLFGGGLSAEEKLEQKGYWPGEWVCADCGYIYAPGTSPPFEEIRRGWKCPQCAGPRRRFVKKAGGIIAAVDDSPLIYGTVGAIVVIFLLTYVGLTI
jgi:rubredoxin